MKQANGFTLVEIILGLAIASGIILGIVRMMPNVESFMLSSRMRQQANSEGRQTLETVRHLLILGNPATRVISQAGNGLPQSDIQFNGADGTHYEIGCSTGIVFFTVTTPGGVVNTKTIASNVNVFTFTPETSDPATVNFKFVSETSLDASDQADRIYRIELPAEIRMEGS